MCPLVEKTERCMPGILWDKLFAFDVRHRASTLRKIRNCPTRVLMKVEYFKHNIDEMDIARVNDVLRSLFITSANVTKEFERKLREYLGLEHCLAVSSCSGALVLSLAALGIKPGDEVITSPLSFVSTAHAICHLGARPVFVDVEETTGNMNAELLEAAITSKTRGIIPVHLYGTMCDMRRIREIADKYDLVVVEDAAHCLEGKRDGVGVGELSDTACFSFYATKNITSGEGGAVVCRDSGLAEVIGRLRLHGLSADAASRYSGDFKQYEVRELGWKNNMSDMQSALLLGQLEKIEERLMRREELCGVYEDKLGGMGVEYMMLPSGVKGARHIFAALLDDRNNAIKFMESRGIGVSVHFYPIHLFEYYRKHFGYMTGDYPVAEGISSRCMSLPLYPNLRDDEVLYVCGALEEFVTG